MDAVDLSQSYILDIGANDGADTAYYAARGFRVVAVEANPDVMDRCRARTADVADRVTYVCAAVTDAVGPQTFYVNNREDVWSSLIEEVGARTHGARAITVPVVNLTERLSDLSGRILYAKIDIESADEMALRQVLALSDPPRYVSIENGSRAMIRALIDAGYGRFAYSNQRYVPAQRVPTDSRMGRYVDHRFGFGDSGLFGDDLRQPWIGPEEALAVDDAMAYGRRVAGQSYTRAFGWFDLHAERRT